jgi:hypothetical protein
MSSAKSNRITRLEIASSRGRIGAPRVHVVDLYDGETHEEAWRAQHGDASPGANDLVVWLKRYAWSARPGPGPPCWCGARGPDPAQSLSGLT